MTLPGLVIFDCDGVLVDSEPLSAEVLARNLTRHGLALTAAECMALFVGGTMSGVRDHAREMGADLAEGWIAEVHAETYAALAQEVEAVAGVGALLDRLQDAGVPVCVASNGADAKMQVTLGRTGLLPRLPQRFSAQSVGIAKPDPGLFLHAAATMGVAPEACVVIEDSATGAKAAARAGMRCLGYAPLGDGAPLIAQGAEHFRHMDEVPGRLHLP